MVLNLNFAPRKAELALVNLKFVFGHIVQSNSSICNGQFVLKLIEHESIYTALLSIEIVNLRKCSNKFVASLSCGCAIYAHL